MSRATFHFHQELNTFLPRRGKNKPVEHTFDWRASIKDMIESLGIPHSEIELILVNGKSVNFNYIMEDEDVVDVYPRFDLVEGEDKVQLRPPVAPENAKFVLDTHLGRLAAYLRMMGFDTLYRNDYPDDELAEVSHHEERILLTRDIGLLKRSLVVHGYFVRETKPKRRLKEIIQRFDLFEAVTPFKHCMKCNGLLKEVEKSMVVDNLPNETGQFYDEFHRCITCEQVYWKGPHYKRMQSFIDDVLNSNGAKPNGQHDT